MKFKIDLSGSCYMPFGLFVEDRKLFWRFWREVDRFETREKAKERYELIKELPEYLN